LSRRVFEATVVLWFAAGTLLSGQASAVETQKGLSLDVGVHCDWVGQRYRLSDDDTLDLFDEKSLSLAIGYGQVFDKGLWAEDKFTLSDHALKNHLTTGWNGIIAKKMQLNLENDLETKSYRWRGEDLYGSSYWENRFKMEGTWHYRPGLRLGAEQKLVYIDYEKSTSYFRDYWLSETTARLDLEMGLLWNLTADYSLIQREVPDSSGMNYVSHLLTSSLDGLAGWIWQFRLDGQLERRQSASHDDRQDYVSLNGQIELEHELGWQLSLVFEGQSERMVYDHPDEIYYNFWSTTGKLGLSRDLYTTSEIALLPTYRRSKAEGTAIGETYRDFGVELELDYSGMGRLWANVAFEVGTRNYDQTEEESFYSNYTYLHPSLLINYRLTDELNLDILAEHEPEWHKQREDDFSTSLFSCSLNYRFW
jgi:hypothetical protein